GEPASLDGTEGQFEIAPPSTQVTDPRGRGRLQYVGKRYLRFAETHGYFLKGGADSPENFLAYYEFDGTRPTHRYAPHARDFRPGDPTWAGDKGRNIVGALNYLAGKGVNSIYFLTMNVEGDGRDVWPWIGARRYYRYDCSKLGQWEIVFSHMDQLGIMLHVVTQEQENDQLLDKGELGPQRRLYYRELVARFAHHLAITWNLGEENTNTDQQRKAFSRAIHALDPYDHPVVVHTFPGQTDKVYAPLLADPSIEGASLQTNETHQQTMRWIDRSHASGRPWVVCLDEIGPADTGVKPDEDDYHHDDVRKRHLWGHFMAGGAGVEWLFGYKYAHNDINLEDFRSRDHMWELTRIARQFFLEYLPFEKMRHADPLVKEGTAYCFAKAGEIYALYLPEGGTARLDLGHAEATYDVDWYNPRTGGQLQKGTVATIRGPATQTIGQPPRDRAKDWAVVIKRRGGM
ncbi:MAG: putative collagen-binding domain-containing protein, partial [Pirellulales bacterium]